jgi:hypothetical protein
MIAVTFAALCVAVRAECRISPEGRDFLQKALRCEKSAQSGFVNAEGGTPLVVASGFGCPSHLKELAKAGFDVNGLDKRNVTALCAASHFGELEVVAELLELGADIEIACTQLEMTALGHAAAKGHAGVTKRLLQAGARVNAQDKNGATAVYWAARENHADVVELLIEGGADPNLAGPGCEPPLYAAAFHGAIEAAKLLAWRGGECRSAFQRPYSLARRRFREQHRIGKDACGGGGGRGCP